MKLLKRAPFDIEARLALKRIIEENITKSIQAAWRARIDTIKNSK